MPGAAGLDINEQGYVQSGRFAGQHISTVLQYAETLETAIKEDGKPTPPGAPPEPPAEPPKPTPAEVLAAHAAGRVDATTLLTWQRLEQDDEIVFRATVPDYDKFLERINKLKEGLQPQQRVTRGVHKFLYTVAKQDDPKVQEALFGKAPDVPPVAPVEPPAEPPPAEPPAAPVAPPAAPSPKAAPPVAAPTPTRTPAPAAVKKSTLKANDKVKKSAEAWHMTVEEYLLQLEESGVTQEQLDMQTAPSNRQTRKSIYDRA